jgi:hypothetical protein
VLYFIIYADILMVYFFSFKVLHAPELQDDICLNLVDWGLQNVLSVGLGRSVYLLSAHTGHLTKLCEFSEDIDSVTSVAWNGPVSIDQTYYFLLGAVKSISVQFEFNYCLFYC